MKTTVLDNKDAVTTSVVQSLDDNASLTRQFVTFIVNNEVFAVDMEPVQEIIREPKVIRVPLAKTTLNGLSNLRGKVLPIISLRRLFGIEEKEKDDTTRVLVIDLGQPLGFVVDRLANVIGVEPSQIEDVGSITSTINTEFISGLIKDVGGYPMIMILNFEKLIEREYTQVFATMKSKSLGEKTIAKQAQENIIVADELQMVSFYVANQEYAFDIKDVQEIVQIPEKIIHVPHSDSHVLGVMTLRSRLLPVVNLRRILALPEQVLDEKNRIIVLAFNGITVGLVVDGVSEVLRIPKANIDPVPSFLARKGALNDITEICRIGDDKRLVSIITARNMFNNSFIQEAMKTVNEMEDVLGNTSEELEDVREEDDEQVVVFVLDTEEFGIPISNVQEIVRVPEKLIRVPKAPKCVVGVTNLRGVILPVLDLRQRLGLIQLERQDSQRIVVFLIEGVRTGFIVDKVLEVLKIPKIFIEQTPQLSSEQGKLLSKMANLEGQKRMIQLMDSAYLLESNELTEISEATREFNDKAPNC